MVQSSYVYCTDTIVLLLVQFQPKNRFQPRNRLLQKKPQKRQFVTTHDLQQKQKQKKRKIINKEPDFDQRSKLRSSPTVLGSQQDASAKGSAKRKLNWKNDTSQDEVTGENVSSTEVIFYLSIILTLHNQR